MRDSMMSALFGAMTQEHRMNMITNNLANVNTTGYKKDSLAFKDTFLMFAHEKVMEPVANVRSEKLFPDPVHIAKPRLAVSITDFSQGSLKETGGPLDVAISGDGFFKFRTPQGDYYSRNGKFQTTADGALVTPDGYTVLGQGGGEIVIPPNAKVSITENGQIYADGELVDALQVVDFEEKAVLEKLGHNMYQIRDGQDAAEQPLENASIQQGFLETANVEVVTEMVNMIETHRQFEAYQKMITTTQESDQKLIQKVGSKSV